MPISNLHDEILQITFEFGTLFQQQGQPHFGSLVSHVARRWRRIALATPSLWIKILFDKTSPGGPGGTYPERQIDRAAAFLFRSMPLPVDVGIEGVGEEDFDDYDDFDTTVPAFLQLITVHIGRCRRLNILDGDSQGLTWILTHFSSHSAPILNSILVYRSIYSDDTWGPERPLFQLGAPHLTTAEIDGIWIPSIPDFLEGLQQLTSLRITRVFIGNSDWDIPEGTYAEFRDSLMALPSLDHLDLTINDIFSEMASRLPMVLPTLRFLRLDAEGAAISDILRSVQADSLIALSLGEWKVEDEEEFTVDDQTEPQFPSLEHLLLHKRMPDLRVFARSFSKIKRLTVGRCDLILPDAETQDNEDGASCRGGWELWPSLQVLAVAELDSPYDLPGLPNVISKVKRGGHPICTLMLPKVTLDRAGVDGVVELKKLVEVEDFRDDWPNPFAVLAEEFREYI